MSDGNTAIHVSPTEDDMSKIASVFQRAAQAIVDASSLPKQIEALNAEVQRLSSELNAKSVHASELDTQLSEMRRARDDAKAELLQTANELSDTQRGLASTQHDNASLQAQIDKLNDQLSTVRKERDDYGMEAMHHADEAKGLKTKLDTLQGHFKSLFPEPETAKPEPISAPPVQQAGEVHWPNAGQPAVKPEPEGLIHSDDPWWVKSANG